MATTPNPEFRWSGNTLQVKRAGSPGQWTSVATVGGGGGGGGTVHSALSALVWTSSGHTGTASRLAGFSGAGAATYYQIGTDVVAPTRAVNTTAPLTGGGTLAADLTLAVSTATTSAVGVVELATDGESASGVVVQGNDSRMSNARTPTAHATSHKLGGSDVILLHEFGLPTGTVAFNDQQASSFRLENRTSDPVSPTEGQIWLRTDL